ncbi:BglII/BstYI family type II restriction endonuclease [Sulfurisoma sediminicola]|uniref:Restriction endonuclease BglII n=1 Tax=Sulfurisoma sediminicola TaxID=1381557 RepID=A0A497XEH8_9PROT|nr:BglII/BstYI family type II restriction endonuclease [Sulfurisoma sediminicola]RLJ64618.1 restriction endonuclease BglII [Sulfurisoma sediminicola]
MKHITYSHEGGSDAVPEVVQREVAAAITAVGVKPAKGATTKVRDAFLKGIQESGWPAEVQLSKNSKMTVTSTKDEIGLCLQTGNMGRMYADLLKLQTMYLNKAIKAAIVVVPSRPVAKTLGDNIANAHRLVRELEIFKLAYSVPTLVFSLE